MKTIKELREQLGLTMEEQAKKLGMSVSMYEKIEYGYREPSKKFIEKFKYAYPYIDINIFFENKVHKNKTKINKFTKEKQSQEKEE